MMELNEDTLEESRRPTTNQKAVKRILTFIVRHVQHLVHRLRNVYLVLLHHRLRRTNTHDGV